MTFRPERRIVALLLYSGIVACSQFCLFNTAIASQRTATKRLFTWSRAVLSFRQLSYTSPLSLNSSYFIINNDDTESETTNTSKVDSVKYDRKTLLTPLPEINRDVLSRRFDRPRYGLPKGLDIIRSLDSTGNKIKIQEQLDKSNIGSATILNLDDYLLIRRQQLSKQTWDSLITNYDLKRALSGGQLSKLLSQATNIAIPLPPNPLTSIFGKPEISINVNGEVNVRGGWRWDSQNLGAATAFGQSVSAPVFTQDIQVNVSAKIGDKLRFGTDWSTRRQFEFDNRFKIGFDGYDDDIIKRVEVGNVTMPTQSAFISGSQALFGVRADFQFGPLFLKTIASQRRGERRFVNVNGGSARTRFVLRAHDYAQNHFFLDSAYKPLYRQFWNTSTPVAIPAGALTVKEVEVYESTANVQDQAVGGIEVIAYDTLSPILSGRAAPAERYPAAMKSPDVRIEQGKTERGRFVRLDATSNRFIFDPNLGTITILNMRRDRTYAVAYRTEGATTSKEDDLYTGTLSTVNSSANRDTLILKLLYRPNLQPGFRNLWARQMRNIYFINSTNVNTADANIRIFYLRTNNDSTDVLDNTPDKLVTALRVDQVNNGTGLPPGDGVFDLTGAGGTTPISGGVQQQQMQQPGTGQPQAMGGSPFFNSQRGEIIFPSLEPFREGLDTAFARRGNISLARQFYYSSVYDNQVELARLQTAQDRWIIVGEVQGQNAGRISLGFNVSPGSVRVRLDGRELRENDDYTVEYSNGVLTLRNPQAANPGANLNVEFEQNDIMNVMTRTHAGIRADMSLYKTRNFQTLIGGTYMHYDMAALIDRVRVGEEPVSNSMIGFDAQLQWKAEWLTKALNWLPFYSSKEMSNINFRGEWAMQLPTPNKRTSTIPQDNNAPVAYIDDFEAAQRYISLGLAPQQWSHATPPVDSTIDPLHINRGLYRGRSWWFQYFIGRVPMTDPYPNRQTIQGRSNISPLEISFDPDMRGIYAPNRNYIDSLSPLWDSVRNDPWQKRPENREKLWGGFQRLISSFNSNFDIENIDFIEVMMRVNEAEPGAKMFIDLGQISEDIIPNNRLNTEDGITSANPVPNGRIDPGEDTGIDALDNSAERDTSRYPYPLSLENDPSRDDYNFNFQKPAAEQNEGDFTQFNNFEGNAALSEVGRIPDTEILNRQNGQTISLDDSYFSYEVNLDGAANNPQVVGTGRNGWRLFRIPLRGAKRIVGNPLFSNIQYVRVWFKGGRIKAQIADWRFAGAQWQRFNYAQISNSAEVTDNTMRVAFVNREENNGPPDFYTMPPGVSPPRNLANPDLQNDILLNEQSLSLTVSNLACGEERVATRFFRTFDMFFYKTLRFFAKGVGSLDYIPQDSLSLTPADTNAPQYFVRFGTDTANYYEYRTPIVREWKSIVVNLQELAAIKSQRDSLGILQRREYQVRGEPLSRYAILGNPILTRVQYVSFGIANPAGRCPRTLNTTVWFNELRLVDVDAKNDWGATGQMDMKLADLGNFRMAYTQTNPYFHRLEERFGSRELVREYSINFDAGFEKFLPKSWKETRIPFTFSRVVRERDPRFQAQNDVNIESAAALEYNRVIQRGEDEASAARAADLVRRRSQTRFAQTQFSVTGFKFGLPLNGWYIRETINKITFGYNYFQEAESSPVFSERFRWQWDFTAQYANAIPAIATVRAGGIFSGIPIVGSYKDWKINFLPQNITLSTRFSRMRRTEQSWFLAFPSPVERAFNATNTMGFQWKLTEGGFLNPTLDYNVTVGSTLVPLELDPDQRQLSGGDVAGKILFNEGRMVDFGTPNTLTQSFTMNFRPKLPEEAGLAKFIDMTGSYATNYLWADPLQPDPRLRDITKRVQYANNIRWNTSIRLRQMTNSWFGLPQQSTAKDDSARTFLGTIIDNIRSLFFDYETFTINFGQTNNANTPGAFGGTGFTNLWGRGFTFRASENFLGPSAAYQLGLVRYPHGSFNITPSSRFPFFGFTEVPGLRPPNAQMQDNFMQRTTIDMRTSRPLWKGATLDLTWKTEFGNNRNQLTTTNALGEMTFSNITITEQYNRTFLTMPNFLMFSLFNNTPENVIQRYRQAKTRIIGGLPEDSLTIDQQVRLQNAMTESFIGGLQAFEFFPGLLSRFLPQVNWAFRWEGIEKYWFLGGIAQRAFLEHTYQSTYTENVRVNDNGRIVDGQQIQMAFQPLIGINVTFDEKKVKGNLTGNLRYNQRTNYNLAVAARTLTRELQHEFQFIANYSIRGFTFPLLGLELKNDVEFSLNTQYRKTSRATFALTETVQAGQGNGGELDGQTQFTIEPRARYTMSNRITAGAFFRYNGTFSTGAANPGFSTTEVGVELRIAISGGR